jgi:tetratricopeptide (TPR) repeat protein
VRQLLFAVLLLAGPAGATSVTPEMDKLVMEGIDALYRMDFDAADRAAEKAIALQPDYPHAHMGAAATSLMRFIYGSEASDPAKLAGYQEKVDRVVAVSEKWLKKHPGDADALLVLGSAHGITSRLALVRRDFLDAFTHGRKSMKSIRAAIKADPQQYDAYLGQGMFDYYVDTIPRFAGWLAKIMLGGDRARGIKNITIAAEKGHYAKTAAQLILVEIYTEDGFGARNPAEAYRLMSGIWAKYPESPMLHSAYIVSLYEDKRYDAARKESEEYLRRVAAGKYPAWNLPKGHTLLGTVLWAAGEKEKALAEFEAGAKTPPGVLRTRWAVWSRVRAGQVLDALGRRDEAVAAYKSALSERKLWDFKAVIKPCLAKPCLSGLPGHYSPNY